MITGHSPVNCRIPPHKIILGSLVYLSLYAYRIKGKIYKACVQSALTYGTETWAMKEANLQSLERTERMMVRWMCGVSLKDRKRSVDLYSLLDVQSVAGVVRRGRVRWFGHVEHKRMIWCQPVEMLWWRGREVRVEGGRLGMNV